MKRSALLLVVALVVVGSPGSAAAVSAGSTTGGRAEPSARPAPCRVLPHATCGSVERLWEPGNPAAGTVTVGYAFVAARDSSRPALGTVVPHEGGPGYSTTGTAAPRIASSSSSSLT